MDEMTNQNLTVSKDASLETRGKEVVEKFQSSFQTDPMQRKLLDFGNANKTRRFSVIDLLKR